MDLEVSRMGERGQIVIPLQYRQDLRLKKGEKFLVAQESGKIILEPVRNLSARALEELKEDIRDIKIIESFWEEVRKGKAKVRSKEEFLKELKKW